MRARASNLMIGTLTLALIGGSLGAFLGYQKLAGIKQKVPFRVIFEGSASGLRKGGSVNFAGIRVGEVVSLKLDHPRRVVALAMIDGNTPVKSDTQVGLEFQGLTGIAAISFTGGSDEAPPPPKGADGIPELTADPEGTLNTQEKIRAALRNVDRVIADNEVAIKDTLRNFETFTASLSGNGEKITSIIATAENGVSAVDDALTKTKDFLGSLASDKYGGELLPTVISMRELIESFDKKSGQIDRRDAKDARRGQRVRQQGRTRNLAAPPPAAKLPLSHNNQKNGTPDVLDKSASLTAPPATVTRTESAVPRALQKYLSLDDFEPTARRRIPKFLYGYISGGAETDAAHARQPQSLRRIRFCAARAQRRLRPRPDHHAVRQDLCLAVRHSADGLFGARRLSRRHRADAGGQDPRTCR